ncbi:hypothetical protein PIB30_058475 [Stylosanthes scabra]|uniref:Replication protein A 70 kDa DNA-binding subunit B/D first OB fold domain-containing protein n=1 Tax=Stylosanthes scabra TaxID=79078 RepID=A0ABU6YHD8_9FABA|nr:hypothetical protein [Stylosanthes scabra]
MVLREDYLVDVHPRYHEWNFNVYVIRMWEVPSKSNPKVMTHVELILQDSKGNRLHAVLNRSMFKRWGGVLAEFKMFNMRSFIVIEKGMKSRTTATNYVLTFSNRTVVTPVVNPAFLLAALRLRSIDVVALAVSRGDPRDMQSKTGKDLKRLSIVVKDLE